MTGYKLLIGATLLLVAGLIVGSIFSPDSLMVSLAGTDMTSSMLRIGVGVLLLVLLFTNPPRSYALRSVLGAGAIVLAIVSVQMLLSYRLYLLDAIVFLEVAILFGIEALEVRSRSIPVRHKETKAHKIPVLSA
jgi:hypothetical protein